jgi:hypothetical protein
MSKNQKVASVTQHVGKYLILAIPLLLAIIVLNLALTLE